MSDRLSRELSVNMTERLSRRIGSRDHRQVAARAASEAMLDHASQFALVSNFQSQLESLPLHRARLQCQLRLQGIIEWISRYSSN